MNPKPNNNTIALTCIVLGVMITAYIFAASRQDPGLRMAALVAATSLGSALIAIASTMLTGKDLTAKRDPSEVPPNTSVQDTTTISKGASETPET